MVIVIVRVPAVAAVLEPAGRTPSMKRFAAPFRELLSPSVASVNVASLAIKLRIVEPVPDGNVKEVVAL